MTTAPSGLPTLPGTDPVVRAVSAWLAAGYVGPSAPLLVAVSGGADSLALAAAVHAVAGRAAANDAEANPAVVSRTVSSGAVSGRAVASDTWRRPLAAAIIDHGLQDGSADVAAGAAEALRTLGYRRVVVRRVAVGTDGGMEAAARAARYEELAAIAGEFSAECGGPAAVLLAHTADDQAETVLLGLGRGSGPRSIAGMRPWAAPWGRPLLEVRRAQTESACAAIGLSPWCDPHNASPAFTRVRLRREVLPLLDEVLGGGVVPALARTAELMADDLAALDDLAARALTETLRDDGDLDCRMLAEWPSAVRRRVLREWARQRAGLTALTYRHLVALEDSVTLGHSGRAVRLPGGIDAVRIRGRLHLPSQG